MTGDRADEVKIEQWAMDAAAEIVDGPWVCNHATRDTVKELAGVILKHFAEALRPQPEFDQKYFSGFERKADSLAHSEAPQRDREYEIVGLATGVKGSFCIGRKEGVYMAYWNPGDKWAGAGYVFHDRRIVEALVEAWKVAEAPAQAGEGREDATDFGPLYIPNGVNGLVLSKETALRVLLFESLTAIVI